MFGGGCFRCCCYVCLTSEWRCSSEGSAFPKGQAAAWGCPCGPAAPTTTNGGARSLPAASVATGLEDRPPLTRGIILTELLILAALKTNRNQTSNSKHKNKIQSLPFMKVFLAESEDNTWLCSMSYPKDPRGISLQGVPRAGTRDSSLPCNPWGHFLGLRPGLFLHVPAFRVLGVASSPVAPLASPPNRSRVLIPEGDPCFCS